MVLIKKIKKYKVLLKPLSRDVSDYVDNNLGGKKLFFKLQIGVFKPNQPTRLDHHNVYYATV